MLKCTLRSPKTIDGGGEEKNLFSKKSLRKKNFLSEIIFSRPPNISCGTQEGARSKQMPWVHLE